MKCGESNMSYDEIYDQALDDLSNQMLNCGEKLKSFDYKEARTGDLFRFCIEIETALFRARIKAERTINQ